MQRGSSSLRQFLLAAAAAATVLLLSYSKYRSSPLSCMRQLLRNYNFVTTSVPTSAAIRNSLLSSLPPQQLVSLARMNLKFMLARSRTVRTSSSTFSNPLSFFSGKKNSSGPSPVKLFLQFLSLLFAVRLTYFFYFSLWLLLLCYGAAGALSFARRMRPGSYNRFLREAGSVWFPLLSVALSVLFFTPASLYLVNELIILSSFAFYLRFAYSAPFHFILMQKANRVET